MSFQRSSRLQRIDQLIRLKATRSPKSFACRLGISEATLYRDIEYMKQLGAPICFDSYRDSYVYTQAGRFLMGFVEEE